MKSVAIIGAGMAGLALGKAIKHRMKVTIFEKSRGLGGRISTRYAGAFEFDHGAQFFVAKSDEFKAFIAPLVSKGVVSTWNANFIELDRDKVISSRNWEKKYPHYIGVPRMNSIGHYLDVKEIQSSRS